ncbi:MAG: hypothetical protein ABW091_04600 [Microbacterium sp.]
MRRVVTVSDLEPVIRSRRMLRESGWTERAIDDARRAGRVIAVRRGWFMDADDVADLWPEGRHLAHVIAVSRDAANGAVASYASAGVLWGLPLYRYRPTRVHLTTEYPTRVSSGRDVLRHLEPLADSDIVVRDGIRCTSLQRTVFDMIRSLGPEAAIACADAGERRFALHGRIWDEDAVAHWRSGLHGRVDAAAGARGVKQARRIAAFADGLAQLPGESVSRLQLVRLGFAVPELQVPVPKPTGGDYFVDFGLREIRAFGEFDGQDKYLDEAMRRGVSLETVLLEEKRREDWIRGTTQWRFARWGSEHCVTAAALASRLAGFGIRPP